MDGSINECTITVLVPLLNGNNISKIVSFWSFKDTSCQDVVVVFRTFHLTERKCSLEKCPVALLIHDWIAID